MSSSINRVTDSYSTVGGGSKNRAGRDDGTTIAHTSATVGGGYSNTASGTNVTVGGGYFNTASGDRAFVGGGTSNTASGYISTIGGGQDNTASHMYTTVPGGYAASASHHGEMAYASGAFSTSGDAQTSLYVLRGTSLPDGMFADLYLNGAGTTELLTIASGRTVVFDILVVGRANTGESVGVQIGGVIENVGGTTDFVEDPTITTLGTDDFPWGLQMVDDDTNDALRIQVLSSGKTVRWVATVRTAEVAW